MSIEEKAKAYDEALEKARKRVAVEPQDHTDAILKDIFPQLHESEDERIRKWLIKTIYLIGVDKDICADQETMDKAIAWLEKQKEQKEELAYRLNGLMQEYINESKDEVEQEHRFKCYKLFWDALEDTSYFDEQQEQKLAWSEEDENYYDTIVRKLEVIGDDCGLSNNQIKFLREHCPSRRSEWSEEDTLMLTAIIQTLERFGGRGTTGMQIDWLKSLRPQPKREWSEEDELHRGFILESLEDQIRFCKKNAEGAHYAKQIRTAQNWLKDLRPHWKPSEQEKGALRTAIHILTEERNFPKAAGHLQAILDVFDGKESRKDWKPSEEQLEALRLSFEEAFDDAGDCNRYRFLKLLYEQLKKPM